MPKPTDKTEAADIAVESVEVAPVTAPAPDYDEAVMAKIKGWVYDNLANGPISRDGACWDALQTALPALARSFS